MAADFDLTNPEHYQLLKRTYSESITSNTAQRWRNWAKYLPVILHLPEVFHIQWAKSTEEWLFLKKTFGVKLVLSLRGAHINYSPVADTLLAETYGSASPNWMDFTGSPRL